jgi:hypothetical protein
MVKNLVKDKVHKRDVWSFDDALNFQGAKAFFVDDASSMRAKDFKKDNLSYFKGFRRLFK